MHNFLFEHHGKLDDQSLVHYAEMLGLNVDQFERDLSEHTFAARVSSNKRSGASSGVENTPAFFINGRPYAGQVEVTAMLTAIQEAAEDISEDQ